MKAGHTKEIVHDRREFLRSVLSAAVLTLAGCATTGAIRAPGTPLSTCWEVRQP